MIILKSKSFRLIALLLAFTVFFTVIFTSCTKKEVDKETVVTASNTESLSSDSSVTETQAELTEAIPPEPPESDDDFVKISDFAPTIKIDLRYSTTNNFTGKVIYDFTDAYIRYGTMKKLVAVQKELAEKGVGLCIWDAYRPLSGQEALYYSADPEDRGIYVASPKGGNHTKGHTVDVTLYDLSTGKLLEMPSGFDDFSEKAHPDKLSDDTELARENVTTLINAMTKDNRFSTISSEWWHFVDTDSYEISDFDPSKASSDVLPSKLTEELTDALVIAFDTLPAE